MFCRWVTFFTVPSFKRPAWRPIISENTGPIFIKFSSQANMWVGMINPTVFLRSLKGRCYGNRFFSHSHTLPSFVRWHSTTDGKIATWVCALTPPMTRLRLIKCGELWSSHHSPNLTEMFHDDSGLTFQPTRGRNQKTNYVNNGSGHHQPRLEFFALCTKCRPVFSLKAFLWKTHLGGGSFRHLILKCRKLPPPKCQFSFIVK